MTVNKSDFRKRIVPDELSDVDAVGVYATGELRIPHGTGYICQRIQTPGLWGIEGGTDNYLEAIFQEESETLTAMLNQLGVTVN